MTATEINLLSFCHEYLPDLKVPFVIDGWLYATNAYVAVRVPTTS